MNESKMIEYMKAFANPDDAGGVQRAAIALHKALVDGKRLSEFKSAFDQLLNGPLPRKVIVERYIGIEVDEAYAQDILQAINDEIH